MLHKMGTLRPGNLYKDFIVEGAGVEIDSRGRKMKEHDSENVVRISGVLAKATPEEKMQYQQLQHPISHTIVQKGAPKANEEDRLIHDDRIFLIQGIDDIGELGLWTIYYVEERFDGH